MPWTARVDAEALFAADEGPITGVNKTNIIKRADPLFGPIIGLLIRLLFHPRVSAGNDRSSFLIIRPGGIGDAVLLIPAIAVLKGHYPDAAIDVLAEGRNSGVFELCQAIRTVYRYDSAREFALVMRNRYDVVIDTEQWHRLSAAVARLTRAPLSIGFDTNARRRMFNHPIAYSQDDYEMESFLHLLGPLVEGAAFDRQQPFLATGSYLKEQATSLLRMFNGRRTVTIFPGGSIRERMWGGERYHQTARQMQDDGCGIVVVGSAEDRADGETIVAGIPNAVNLCGELSLAQTAAVLELTALLITGDSGIMHLGYAVGTKIIALFGPGRESKWGPHSPRVSVINRHLVCSPCTTFGYTPKCPIDAKCMKEITVDQVVKEARVLLRE